MSMVTLDNLINKIGSRALAYAIYSLLTVFEPQILIVDTKEEAELLENFLKDFLGDIYGSPTLGVPKIEEPFKVISRDEYQSNWKKFVGKRLVFVKDDKNIRSDAVNGLKSIIEKVSKTKYPPPEERLKSVLEDMLALIYRIKGEINSKGGSIDDPSFYLDLIKKSVVFDEEVPLILEIMKVHGYNLSRS